MQGSKQKPQETLRGFLHPGVKQPLGGLGSVAPKDMQQSIVSIFSNCGLSRGRD